MKNCTPLWREAHFQVKMYKTPQLRTTFGNVLRATRACTFSTSQLPKVVRTWCALYILTWTCASRHNGVHFFDISSSKSAPDLVCFVHFDLEMCFAPQRRALFRHRNFRKLRCRKSARPCGAKHISKSKCTKHLSFGPLLEVQMSKKCRKSARCCGAKHISKSKVSKTEGFEPFLT